MDYTEGTTTQKTNRAKKMMLWFGIISLSMSFAGLTSAYVVSKERVDWLETIQIPHAFLISLLIIITSSISIHFAKNSITNGNRSLGSTLLWATFLLGCLFMYFQYKGFSEIYNDFGYAFTGPTSSITYSFIFIIVVVHIAHVIAAMISLLVVIYNNYKQRYFKGKTLGLDLAVTFWHFVDFLWIYLFLFFYFVK